MGTGTAVFLDTSVQIARMVHSREMRKRIDARVKAYDVSVASLVVKQEFKRRLMREAQYLLNQLNKRKSVVAVQRHIVDVLPPVQARKRNICLDMLTVIFERYSDLDRTERAKRYLRSLLRIGLKEFDESVDYLTKESGCACAQLPVIEKVPYRRYDIGPEKCSTTGDRCKIVEFLQTRIPEVSQILEKLRSIPEAKKSPELQRAQEFAEMVIRDPSSAQRYEPCLRVGDLIIATESVGCSVFYTLNGKESQYLCRALSQDMVVRPKNPAHEDVECPRISPNWPEF